MRVSATRSQSSEMRHQIGYMGAPDDRFCNRDRLFGADFCELQLLEFVGKRARDEVDLGLHCVKNHTVKKHKHMLPWSGCCLPQRVLEVDLLIWGKQQHGAGASYIMSVHDTYRRSEKDCGQIEWGSEGYFDRVSPICGGALASDSTSELSPSQ